MKALIVEDELLESTALTHILQNHFPKIFSQVLSARDGEEAVALALENRPDLIFMDINLPILNGIEAAKQIWEKEPNIKMIMISAYSDYLHLRESMRNHALDYIVKPYSVETLCEAVNRVLFTGEKTEVYGKAAVVQKAKDYLELHYADNVSLQDVASEVNLEKSYLGRLFRDENGMTVMSCLKEIRLQHAKEQLMRGRSATEVAFATGFGDLAYFSRYFKQMVGCSPTHYRRNESKK